VSTTIPAEDELQNVNLADEEAVAAAKERKRKAKAAYTGYDDDEFDPERVGIKADVLGKYDDEYLGGGKNQVGGGLCFSLWCGSVIADDGCFRTGAFTRVSDWVVNLKEGGRGKSWKVTSFSTRMETRSSGRL
jgi:hypothetical protein